jgi:Ser/Thr protein kinase RdoA (MazF antagonist)
VLATSTADSALVLEPLAGRRLDGLATPELVPALRALGAGLATLHHGAPPPARRFDRLLPERLSQAAEILGQARPDCREAAAALCSRLLEGDAAGPDVHVHGDANLRNALLDGGRVALVDLEDAAAGPAAADLGFVLAGLVAARVQGRTTATEHAGLAAALLAGYASAAALPERPALRWHTAASALARVAMPAVGRVRPVALARLDALLAAARELAP